MKSGKALALFLIIGLFSGLFGMGAPHLAHSQQDSSFKSQLFKVDVEVDYNDFDLSPRPEQQPKWENDAYTLKSTFFAKSFECTLGSQNCNTSDNDTSSSPAHTIFIISSADYSRSSPASNDTNTQVGPFEAIYGRSAIMESENKGFETSESEQYLGVPSSQKTCHQVGQGQVLTYFLAHFYPSRGTFAIDDITTAPLYTRSGCQIWATYGYTPSAIAAYTEIGEERIGEVVTGDHYTYSEKGDPLVAGHYTVKITPEEGPIADAGPDQSVNLGDQVTLDGSKSYDAKGDELKYSWVQTAGPPIQLSDASSSKPTFLAQLSNPSSGTSSDGENRTFRLTVENTKGETASDEVTIKISCRVDILVDAFLPGWTSKGRLPNPVQYDILMDDMTGKPLPLDKQVFDYHEFATDNRNTPLKGGSARLSSYVVVDLCSGNPLVEKQHKISPTRDYRMEYKGGKFVEVEDVGIANDKGMHEKVTKNGDKVLVQIDGAASNPFLATAPDIDYHVAILLWKEGNIINYTVSGNHDGFPGYEVFIGNKLVHFWTPKVEEGQNPLSPFNRGQSIFSLFGSGDIDVEVPHHPGHGELPVDDAYDEAFHKSIKGGL